ncbi:unnamed protein product [Caenorhabditis angaria]|uniref:Uncharacterized protein n=1 Tax=Caenorhabditis angaria TaxID=860376 RepID=A0A9P1J0J5_9PELO|nr:unnamed protein product [Caenorhabditis angaria]
MVVVELSQEDYESINGIRQRVLEVKKWTGYIDIVASEEIKLRTRSLFAQCQEIRAEIQDFMIHYHQSADNQMSFDLFDFPNRFNPYIPPDPYYLISIEQLKVKRFLMENIESIFDKEQVIYQKTTAENAQKLINETEAVYYEVGQVLTVFDYHLNMGELLNRTIALLRYTGVILTYPPYFQIPPLEAFHNNPYM